MLLDRLGKHLKDNGIDLPIRFNFSSEQNEDCVVLWQYDGTPKMVARNAKVQITSKHSNMLEAQKVADLIYSILYPIDQYKKAIAIDGEFMQIRPIQEPFYNEKDDCARHCFVFNIDVNYNRS